ncbi:MAG: HAD hydrolase family protein, partial [Thermaurantiacus tibetensis]
TGRSRISTEPVADQLGFSDYAIMSNGAVVMHLGTREVLCRNHLPIRAALEALAARHGLPLVVPPPALCTDNAAMVAWAAIERRQAGLADDPHAPARARWPLDADAEPVRGAGVKA